MLYQVVKTFMKACDQIVTIPNEEQAKLYLSLCLEEYKEFLEAEVAEDDVDMLDACCDLTWVAIGALISSGTYNDEFDERINELLISDRKTNLSGISFEEFDIDSVFSAKARYFFIKLILASINTTTNQYGWQFLPAFYEVARSNMAKIDPATGRVLKREDGKVLKPEGWKPPNLDLFV